jgi:hypothetical protein
MVLDIDESPDENEIAAVLEHQNSRIERWRRQSLLSAATLLLIIGANSLFFAGMPLHFLWEAIGENFLFVTFGGMLWTLYSVLALWSAFSLHRDFKKTYSSKEN